MKKTIKLIGFSMVAGAFALAMSLTSCEKEQLSGNSPQTESTSNEKPVKPTKPGSQSAEKAMPGYTWVGESCKRGQTCTGFIGNNTKLNKVSFQWTNHPGGTYKYCIYKYVNGGANQVYSFVTSFNCNSSTVEYANSILENSTYYVLGICNTTVTPPSTLVYNQAYATTDWTSAIGAARFYTSNFKGQSGCTDTDPQPWEPN